MADLKKRGTPMLVHRGHHRSDLKYLSGELVDGGKAGLMLCHTDAPAGSGLSDRFWTSLGGTPARAAPKVSSGIFVQSKAPTNSQGAIPGRSLWVEEGTGKMRGMTSAGEWIDVR